MRPVDVEPCELHPQVLKGSDLDLTHALAAEFQDGADHFKLHAIPRGHVKGARYLRLVEPWGSILVEGLFLHEPDLAIPVNVEKEVVTTRHVRARSILQVGAGSTGEREVPGERFVRGDQGAYNNHVDTVCLCVTVQPYTPPKDGNDGTKDASGQGRTH